jgi:hypothetical protein
MIKNIIEKEKVLSLKQLTQIISMIPNACILHRPLFQLFSKLCNSGQSVNRGNRGAGMW